MKRLGSRRRRLFSANRMPRSVPQWATLIDLNLGSLEATLLEEPGRRRFALQIVASKEDLVSLLDPGQVIRLGLKDGN